MAIRQFASICLAASALIASAGAAPAQMTYPLKELEASQRARVEADKRMKRETNAQLQKDKERAATNVRQDAAAKKAASQPAVSRP